MILKSSRFKKLSGQICRIAFLILLGVFCSATTQAQNQNDCEGAIVICDDGPVNYTPIGPGMDDFNNSTCGTSEHQSAWYYFEFSDIMPPNLILEFTITPTDGTDYDFAMWGPNVDCDDLDAAGMIRCNFSPVGVTGLVVGGGGSAFEEALTVNPNEGYFLLVDNFQSSGSGFNIAWGGSAAAYLDCNANPNCELTADAGDIIYFCEGQPFDLVATVSGGNGNATYNWKGFPPGVTAYIIDTSAAITSVNIPVGFGTEFEFLLTVTEDSCSAQAFTAAIVQPPSEPTFNIITDLCETEAILVLPTESTSGLPGSWDPMSIDPANDVGPITAVFTPDDNIGSCVDTASLTFTIAAAIEPLFDLPTELCEADDVYTLPTTSDDGHTGVWLPGIIDPASNAGSSITATFTVSDPGCFIQTEWTLTINSGVVPTFNFENTICEAADPLVLDPFSDDGYAGQWSIDVIDPAGLSGFIISSTFTPDPVVGECLLPYMHEWTVVEPAVPLFPAFDDLCALDAVLIFPIESLNGDFFGTWNPSEIDPSALGGGSYVTTFTPDVSFGDCVEEVTVEITVDDEIEVNFEPDELCELAQPYTLPSETTTGVTGSWMPAIINPANLGGTDVVAIFTPTADLCAQPFELIIPIEAEEEVVFDIPLTICDLASPISLASTSQNGIQGTWDNPVLDPSNATGDFIVSSFIPDPILHPCAESVEYITLILASLTPEFVIPLQLCELDNPLILETTSLNGLSGEWTIPAIDPINAGGNIIETTFIPDDIECTESLTLMIEILSKPDLSLLTWQNPGDCGTEDGEIIVQASQSDAEYSIDGGTTWQSAGNFDRLPGGSYTIRIRLSGLSNCVIDTTLNLTSRGAPEIIGVVVDDMSDCHVIDGRIQIIATGTQLEYSIDNGLTWQPDPLFEGLGEGIYQIVVREIGSSSCQSVSFATISSPLPVVADSIVVEALLDCGADNGRLTMLATGENLEYSLDNGASWQMSATFDGLNSDFYFILVRNQLKPGCADGLPAQLTEPVLPQIDGIISTDLTDCQSQDGRIQISASNGFFEYSIDGGNNWQLDSIFINLIPGTYQVAVRRIGAVSCIATDETRIVAPNAPSIDSVVLQALTDCGSADAQLEFFASGSDLEYSIDNGVNWQSSSSFSNLGAGIYNLLVRSSTSINCIVTQTAEISALEPPEIINVIIRDVNDCLSANGSVEINATAAAAMEYSIDNLNWQSSNIFSNLNAGNIMAYVRLVDHPNCLDTDFAEIMEIAPPVISELQIEEISECGRSDGLVRILLSAGTNVEFSLDGINWQVDNFFESLPAGDYIVQVREIASPTCLTQMMFKLEEPECACSQIEFTANVVQPLCHDEATGQISIITNLPNLEFDIQWNNAPSNSDINNLSADTYTYVATYFDNCIFSDSVEIINPQMIQADILTQPTSCPTISNGSILITPLTGRDDYSYSVNGVDFQATALFENLATGMYEVVIRNSLNCQSVISTLLESQLPLEPLIFGINSYIFGDTVELMAQYDETRVDSFYWVDQSGRVVSRDNPLLVVAEHDEEYIFITWYDECEARATQSIFVSDRAVYFPTAFSPNNDGVNDKFLPFIATDLNSSITYDLQIFNRWGGKVFETRDADLTNLSTAWNGRQNDKDEPIGLYIYTSRVYLENGRVLDFSGQIQLVR